MDRIISDNNKKENAAQYIADADLLLIGVGTEISSPWCDEDEIKEFYNNLKKIIGDRQYFIITLNHDGYVRDCGFDDEYIVEPCGTVRKLQCEAACSNDIYDADEYEENNRFCPKCGKPLIPNTVEAANYVEEGYLEDWKRYTSWISCTLNRKLCVMELGVKMEYPSVIRWPFEKIVTINNKARFVRLNNSLPQLSEDISKKGTGIKGDPCRFVRELATN